MPHRQDDQGARTFEIGTWVALVRRAGEFRRIFVWLVAVMVVLGATDALFPLMNGIAVDRFAAGGGFRAIRPLALGYAALAVVQGTLIWVLIALAGRIETGLMYRFRQDAFAHIQELHVGYFDTTPVGWLMSRLTSDIQRLGETVAWGLVDIVWGFAMMLGIAVAMLILNPGLGALVLVVVPPLALVSWYFQTHILRAQRRVRRINSEISASYSEGIAGVMTSKTLVREEENAREFGALAGSMRQASVRSAVFSSLYMPVVLVLGSVGTSLALMGGGVRVETGAVTIGVVVAFVGYTVQFFEPIQEVARVMSEFQAAQSAAERVTQLLNTKPEIVDGSAVIDRFGTILEPKVDAAPPAQGSVRFEHVSFAYNPDEPVLADFSLDVAAGESIALVGETGAGKSTIVNLVARFYEPTDGSVQIDGTDIRSYGQSWIHRQIGYVLQTPQLFRGTIAENIAFGRPGASQKEIETAARHVDAHPMIVGLPGGYQFELGEGGSGLSTGEKQLISFARAILSDPRIFILDEATSSIDTETELRIQHAIRSLVKGRTSFIIAHRLSTVRDVDRILVLEHGRIVEAGSHVELVAQEGQYAELYQQSLR